MSRRSRIALAVALVAVAAAVWGWLLWSRRPARPAPPPAVAVPPPPPPDRLDLSPAGFADLPGWEADDPSAALAAFRRSCGVLTALPAEQALGAPYAGTAGGWGPVCAAADRVASGSAAARAFFSRRFVPFAASNHGETEGMFTGYYEPTLDGSRRRHGAYRIPLYGRPPELVSVDLGQFRDDLTGRRIAGRVRDGRLVPFPDRREIEGGALAGRGLEVVWVDDAVDAFFLQIQGSGVVRLDDGGELRVGYAAQNGQPYRAIGAVLVEAGELTREEVSMQSIRAWLESHPERAAEIMAANPSYVFFRRLRTGGPVGAQGVVLTPERSLAVDGAFHALGVPMWWAGTAPAADARTPDRPLRRLLVAQDTGGAIRGPVRGDVFWGPGDAAEEIAGRMKHPGRLWVLLPREVAARGAAAPAGTAGAAAASGPPR